MFIQMLPEQIGLCPPWNGFLHKDNVIKAQVAQNGTNF
jgi:hypothetical protein